MKQPYLYIQPPNWCKDAKPSRQGWHHPVTGELLISVPGGIPMIDPVEEKKPVKESETVINETIDKPVINENLQSKPLLDESAPEKNLLDETVSVDKPLLQESKTPARKRTPKVEK